MDKNRRCTQCGATNPVDSRFCVRCGAPTHLAVEDPSVQSSGPLTSPQPSPKRLNRRYVIYAVVGIIIVAAAASIPYFLPQSQDYTNQINQITRYYQSYGWTIVVPFKHTSVFGADAYVGTVAHNLTFFNTTLFPRSSYSDANSFQQTVIYQYESQGFVHAKTVNGSWEGITNDSFVSVSAIPANGSATGSPAVLVTQLPFLNPLTSSAQVSTASSSALVQRSSSSLT